MLYSGARPGEIAQLHVADMREQHGVWIMHITAEGEGGKRTKTKGSMRVVPVHSELIRLGLIKHRNAGGQPHSMGRRSVALQGQPHQAAAERDGRHIHCTGDPELCRRTMDRARAGTSANSRSSFVGTRCAEVVAMGSSSQ